ncbi:MAG: FapA family protein, partial [Gammaproteobacteria bacterium]|nr:FapA family protein [Gammaproteobacteria bacterium]
MILSDQEDLNKNKTGEPVNGSFSLRVSKDQLAVYLSELSQPVNGGDAVSTDMVIAELRKQKIITGIDKDKIKHILASSSADASDEELCIAEGVAAVAGEDDEFVWNIPEQTIQQGCAVVLPDEVIATYKEATKGVAGKNVYGKTISPRPGTSRKPVISEGVKKNKLAAGEEFISTILGLVANKPGYYQTVQVDKLLEVSFDGTEACMDIYAQTAHGQEITTENIINDLSVNGITQGIDEDIIQSSLKAVANLSSGKSLNCVEHVIVARGTRPETGKDDELIWNIPQQHIKQGCALVLPDDIIASYQAATPGIPGRTVNGKEISPTPGATRHPVIGNGLKTNKLETGEEFISTLLGLVTVKGDDSKSIQLESLVQLSDDGMQACMDIYAHTSNGQEINCEHIINDLAANNVIHGINEDVIQLSLKQAANVSGNKLLNCVKQVIVAQGTQAESGKNDELIWNIPEYYMQQDCAVVLPDEIIATYHQATPGIAGKTVNGKDISPRPGASRSLQIGEGIKASKIETGEEYASTLLGLVTVEGEESQSIQVNSLLQTTDDGMEAYMDIYAQTANGQDISCEHIINDLSANNVSHGVDEDIIRLSLKRAVNVSSDKPLACIEHVLVAKGSEIVPCKDASLILSREKDVVGAELSHGYIDFHEL